MKINRDKSKGYHYLDKNNIILSTSYSQDIGDSLGRNSYGSLIYDEDQEDIVEGILYNFRYQRTSPETGYHFYISRYPVGENWAAVGSSRDHAVKAIAALKLAGRGEFVKDYIKNRAKRPCIDHPYTTGQKIWFKGLYSNFMSWVYAITITPINLLNMGLNELSRPLIKKDIYPTYAAFYTLFSAQALKSKSAKKYLFKLLKHNFEKTNYVAQAICGKTISKEDFESYVPTRKNRWTTRLDGTSDRDLTLYPKDTPETNIELGFLHYMYNKQKK